MKKKTFKNIWSEIWKKMIFKDQNNEQTAKQKSNNPKHCIPFDCMDIEV